MSTVEKFSAHQPPSNLSAKGRSIWRQALTARRIELWDAPALEMLGMMCRTWSEWHRLQERLESMDVEDPVYGQKLRLADLLAARASTLATKLRLTPQSLDKKLAATGRGRPHPIDFGSVS